MECNNVAEAFKCSSGSRPNGTSVIGEWIIHYTCNAPSLDTLAKHGIIPVGEKYDVKNKEVVLIPKKMFEKSGVKRFGTVEAEHILRDLKTK